MASNFVTNILAFIIVLGFLIFIHEAGHFLVAKLFRVRVLVFSLGFGKRIAGFEKGGTEYRIAIVPLGGYVRMAGDNPEEATGTDPGEFLAKPKWQRFLILVAGPAMNILVAIVFLAGLFMTPREVPREFPASIGTVLPGKPAAKAGLRGGDRILTVNGDPIATWDDLRVAISIRPETKLDVVFLRNGVRQTTSLVPERQLTQYGSAGIAGITPYLRPEVGKVIEGSAAAKAGLQRGDLIVRAGGTAVNQWTPDFDHALDAAGKRPMALTVNRGGKLVELTLPGPTGNSADYPGFTLPTVLKQSGPVAAFQESIAENVKMVRLVFFTIGRLFRAEGSVQDFSGPISIARISGDMLRSGWQALIFLMASISLQLGILNLFPVPVLDGGHIFILGVEAVARRDLSMVVKERIQQVGFALLAALMIVVLYNDVIQNVTLMKRG
ncbi:MAG: RIP metalloprotease RseP [Acidobacteriota bacterium]